MHLQKTALITGASRGIGAAIATILAQNGYDCIMTCSNTLTALEQLAHRLSETYSVKCTAVLADAGNEEDIRQLFNGLEHLDVLVNNAGISHMGLLSDMTSEEWHRVMNVNLGGLFYTCKRAIPLMLHNHAGHIINISSIWGNVGASMEVAYSASKGGVNAFTKALAKELAPSGISVNAIACGVIDTQMNAILSPEEKDALKEEIPADRFGTCEEVASLVYQLINAPGYLTGQIITLDGGFC